MQRTILVPLDGMPVAEAAIPLARCLADCLDARLELLRVVPDNAPIAANATARSYLEDVGTSVELANLQIRHNVMRGDPARCIARRAAAAKPELIVMTTHARSGLRRAVLGSVAESVVAHATVPTVLVRAETRREPRLVTLLVALDSTCAAPIKSIVELARAAVAKVVLLHVVPAEQTAIWQWQRGDVLEEPQTLAIARAQLEDLAAYFEEHGISARVRVQLGQVAPTIVAVAGQVDADLIVMATHARTGAQRAIVGSVTDAVVHGTCTPLLVARQIPMPRCHLAPP